MSAPSQPEHADSVSSEQFSNILQYLRRLFTYVVVDTSSTLTDAVLSAIDASNLVLLIVTQDIPSINNARLFLDLAEILDLDRRSILFVMNRFDKRIAITAEKVGENLKQDIAAVLPLDERVVVPSVNRGVPFVINSKGRPITRSILDLAEAVRQRLAEIEQDRETATNIL